ncbi:hypothetical protein [Methylorubrum extorquens]|jgi:hypothetical protein|uniref:Uncharacterized protein n=3 Tax=Methylorubrum extorquens TaxID=408 RepID=B7L227_METC4|nr:hypothetical protein [Methylorubrum extorquens]ACK81817.1 conserved hypothetical protein [Methylorubrum extorquens CM4]KQP00111.1 hypothetical protein ASF33_00645 [Methylobacterium sp. Leaf92]WHQ70905.1 hypothetical protein KEC54_04690 [Methylorubrum extorquens]CAX22700.1 protein of unknown function [Methylorubrum extorquens DM4]
MTPSTTAPSKTPSSASPLAPTAKPGHGEGGATGSVVPFAPATTRRFRREADDAPRGQILLFMGVRYERMPEAEALPVPRRRRS